MKKSVGFTLLELIVVILLVSILAASAVSRFANKSDFSLKTEQEQLISALFQAQQWAMSGRPTQFVILSANSFTVRDAGNSANHYGVGSLTYPQDLTSGVTFNPTTLVLTYTGLGATSAAIITLSAGGDSVRVRIEDSGYAHVL